MADNNERIISTGAAGNDVGQGQGAQKPVHLSFGENLALHSQFILIAALVIGAAILKWIYR